MLWLNRKPNPEAADTAKNDPFSQHFLRLSVPAYNKVLAASLSSSTRGHKGRAKATTTWMQESEDCILNLMVFD
jgi:hypothetical protein